jgi:hypothetical protein
LKIQKVEVIPSELGLITATLAFMAGFATESQYSLYLQPSSYILSQWISFIFYHRLDCIGATISETV